MTAKPPGSAPPRASSSPFADCLAVDQRRLRSLARDLRHLFGGKREALSAEHDRLLGQSRAAVAARRARLPTPEFADDLPVNLRREEIAALIDKNPVVIVCGETGSGKTTQIPKICLEIGRGTTGLIGHTQPRRIAARATAARLAQELRGEFGTLARYFWSFEPKPEERPVRVDWVTISANPTRPGLAPTLSAKAASKVPRTSSFQKATMKSTTTASTRARSAGRR